jgi:predicted ArsR family transcriptional regulator
MNQQKARALADPTRYRIFEYLSGVVHPVGIGELTAEFGLNHNAVRQHLAKLVEAGIVVQTKAASRGRGRPRQLYEIHPVVDEESGGPYRRLSLLLVEMLRSGDPPAEVGRRAGSSDPVAVPSAEGAVDELGRAMKRGGFDPVLMDGEGGPEFVLRRCPFAETAVADPETVCALHLGLAQGLADRFHGVVVDELQPRDPRLAGCRLRFHVEAVS